MLYDQLIFLAVMTAGFYVFSYWCVKQSFFYEIDVTADVLTLQSKIGKIVFGLSCGTMAFLLHDYRLILPHRNLNALAAPCFLLAITCALYIAYEISSARLKNEHEKDEKYRDYTRPMPMALWDRFDRWGAMNQAIAITGLICFGLAYFIIGGIVFFGK
jgi:hypothetical protein